MIEHVGKWQFLISVIAFDICVFLICVVGVLMRRDFIFEDEGE